ncbi:MAG: 50S ribosomal protein L24 [Candidatus Paceibacterota bacterium]|jgi:large subunit ribosomal protein L24
MHIKKGDNVIILSGDDKGKTGKVVKAFPSTNKILVEGINTVRKHERARKEGQKGQTVTISMPFNASKAKNADEAKPVKTAKPAKSTKK